MKAQAVNAGITIENLSDDDQEDKPLADMNDYDVDLDDGGDIDNIDIDVEKPSMDQVLAELIALREKFAKKDQ